MQVWEPLSLGLMVADPHGAACVPACSRWRPYMHSIAYCRTGLRLLSGRLQEVPADALADSRELANAASTSQDVEDGGRDVKPAV